MARKLRGSLQPTYFARGGLSAPKINFPRAEDQRLKKSPNAADFRCPLLTKSPRSSGSQMITRSPASVGETQSYLQWPVLNTAKRCASVPLYSRITRWHQSGDHPQDRQRYHQARTKPLQVAGGRVCEGQVKQGHAPEDPPNQIRLHTHTLFWKRAEIPQVMTTTQPKVRYAGQIDFVALFTRK